MNIFYGWLNLAQSKKEDMFSCIVIQLTTIKVIERTYFYDEAATHFNDQQRLWLSESILLPK